MTLDRMPLEECIFCPICGKNDVKDNGSGFYRCRICDSRYYVGGEIGDSK